MKNKSWYIVELETFLFGKETQYIESLDKEEAEIIVKRIITKKYSCPENHVDIVSCKKIIM